MSKTLALLKHSEEQRIAPAFGLRAKTISFWIISVIIVIILLILLVFNQKLFSMVKENTAENFANSEKLNKIENMLQDYTRQAKVNSDVIHKLNNLLDDIDTRLKETEENVTKLKESNEEKFTKLTESASKQVSAIQLLIKEKDTIFEKITSLETEIEKIKVENATRAASNTTTTTALIE